MQRYTCCVAEDGLQPAWYNCLAYDFGKSRYVIIPLCLASFVIMFFLMHTFVIPSIFIMFFPQLLLTCAFHPLLFTCLPASRIFYIEKLRVSIIHLCVYCSFFTMGFMAFLIILSSGVNYAKMNSKTTSFSTPLGNMTSLEVQLEVQDIPFYNCVQDVDCELLLDDYETTYAEAQGKYYPDNMPTLQFLYANTSYITNKELCYDLACSYYNCNPIFGHLVKNRFGMSCSNYESASTIMRRNYIWLTLCLIIIVSLFITFYYRNIRYDMQ